jgi:hypothetical protein
VRVTLVGSKCFAVRIDSQSHEQTRVDYRRAPDLNSYEPITLSAEATDRLQQFLRRCDLEYGAFDLIATPAGELVFLELNPVGQWLWLQHRTGLDISGAIAELLIGVSDRA